jgi:hypothetical protein
MRLPSRPIPLHIDATAPGIHAALAAAGSTRISGLDCVDGERRKHFGKARRWQIIAAT